MKRSAGIAAGVLIVFSCTAQEINLARELIDTLTSPTFWGRGYTKDGMSKTARFLATQFKSMGLEPLNGKSFFQEFTYPVNTFPGKMEVKINGVRLKPGIDFIVNAKSSGVKTKSSIAQKDRKHFFDSKNKIEVEVREKLTWSASKEIADYTLIEVDQGKFDEIPADIIVNIENKFNEKFKASNVCGLVKGTSNPDSLLIITAHYDHLGGMGADTYFPGANDNASGVALLLLLAKHFASNPPSFSIVFIAFAGEEAGLIGSRYFSDNPLVPLNKIRFMMNVDLVGTGVEGITVVNGSVFNREFNLLKEINDQKKYLTNIKSRGKAANSDHYWFTEKGVPSFFIYTMGGISAYHDVYDISQTLPLTEINDLFHLIADFNGRLMSRKP